MTTMSSHPKPDPFATRAISRRGLLSGALGLAAVAGLGACSPGSARQTG